MERMSPNKEIPRRDFGDSLKLTNWILDSGAACHMKPEIQYFIPVLLAETDKYNKVADGHLITVKNRISSNKNV